MSSTFRIILVLVTAMSVAVSAATTMEDSKFNTDKKPYSTRNGRAVIIRSCKVDPSVCRGREHFCCYKQCVNVKADRLNCGKCGKRCKYSEICCQGECVNPSFNERHCGRCSHECSRGSSCVYGLCSYA